jgi:hypothetical protein
MRAERPALAPLVDEHLLGAGVGEAGDVAVDGAPGSAWLLLQQYRRRPRDIGATTAPAIPVFGVVIFIVVMLLIMRDLTRRPSYD